MGVIRGAILQVWIVRTSIFNTIYMSIFLSTSNELIERERERKEGIGGHEKTNKPIKGGKSLQKEGIPTDDNQDSFEFLIPER